MTEVPSQREVFWQIVAERDNLRAENERLRAENRLLREVKPIMSDKSALDMRNEGYLDGWSNGRTAQLEELEAIALHWERETGGGWKRMREGARWLRTAIHRVRCSETYEGCEHQGPNPWERIAELEADLEDERALRRAQNDAAFAAIERRGDYRPKRFTKYPCPCGATISNAGYAAQAHLRGSLHRQNMERKTMGLDLV